MIPWESIHGLLEGGECSGVDLNGEKTCINMVWVMIGRERSIERQMKKEGVLVVPCSRQSHTSKTP